MVDSVALVDRNIRRRMNESWSVEIPAAFAGSFVDGSYWHACDDDRSVSMSSVLLSDPNGPVSADRILSELPPLDGRAIDELPAGLVGRATTGPTIQPAKASRMLTGMLAVDGRLLIVTITSDDLDWARRVWRSIRFHRSGG